MTRDDWFLFSRGLAKHTYTETTTWTAYPESHQTCIQNISLELRNSKILSCWCWLFVACSFIYHYFLICRRFKFNIFNMNMCRHSDSNNNNNSSGAFQNCISFFFGAHMALCESKCWKSQKNRYKFIIRMGAAREEVLFFGIHRWQKQTQKEAATKKKPKLLNPFACLNAIGDVSSLCSAQTGWALHVLHANVIYFFSVLGFGFGLAFAQLFFSFCNRTHVFVWFKWHDF